MFKKVLIADDHDDINKGVSEILASLAIPVIKSAQYCDEAYVKIKKAALDHAPFDLIITDLSFKKDHRNCDIISGEDLILKIRTAYPELPIIVYSMKDQLQKVRFLIRKQNINGYVCKDRNGSAELLKAVESVSNQKIFVSPQVAGALGKKQNIEIDDFDITLLKQLSLGSSQDQISTHFKAQNISPSSLSSVEKRLNKLRIQFKANNAIHLVAIVKDLGLI